MNSLHSFLGIKRRHSLAFTLIELLVVISIIAVLAALAFPAVNGAIDSAKKAKAKSDVTQIVTAIKAYQTEYGRLPIWTAGDDWYDSSDNNNLFDILRGHTAGNNNDRNPRRIAFIEIRPAKNNKDGLAADGKFYDPWGTPYFVKIDIDYNNEVEYYGNVSGSAIAGSMGKNKAQNDPAKSGFDDVLSFR
jgi:prepilin-type N-terminal cleavage/methylation domain-containing protein